MAIAPRHFKRKNPNALREVYMRYEGLRGKEVAVGFPSGKCQPYPDGTEVAFVAACHVYGMGVPQRDFMALAQPGIIKKTPAILKRAMKAESKKEKLALLESAGMKAQAEIRKAIVDLDSPPNAPSTIAAKGSDNPLIDTGHMLKSVTYVVRDKSKK